MQDLTDAQLQEMEAGRSVDQRTPGSKFLQQLICRNIHKYEVFNDSIHGHIELHPLLVRIINTLQFYRLRNIKQLGGAYFVYPGACHNRFEHSIGVAHLAGRLVQALRRQQPKLKITPRDELCVQIAGLCHDLGHGPFSHLFDGMFIPKMRSDVKWKHEKASVEMFKHMVKVNNLKVDMEKYNLKLPDDLVFIIELINGHLEPNEYEDLVRELTETLGLDDKSTESQDLAAQPIEDEDEDKDAEFQAAWKYKGRPESKSFLYDIVANKTNGIDVDKMDYFARDCHHLGIRNNFDFERFLMFARVCVVDGKKQICTRDKEVHNLYEMFHTRYRLHKKAYQHKVVKIIEIMIAEAFEKADRYIQIPGSDPKKPCTLSTAIDDMEAYTKLTDHVFDQILYSKHDDFADAKAIMKKIVDRELYKCVDELRHLTTKEIKQDEFDEWYKNETSSKPDVSVQAEDIIIKEIKMDYGMKEKNPINAMWFYRKNDPDSVFQIRDDEVSELLPKKFSEKIIRVFCKKTDTESLDVAKKYFKQWYDTINQG